MLHIRLLGGLSVRASSGLVDLPGGKPRLLLAYLLLASPAAYPRERLAGLFWPEAPPDRAGRYLLGARRRRLYGRVAARGLR